MNMKKFSIALMLALIATVMSFEQEYTVYYSGETQGYLTVTKDTEGKITIQIALTKGYNVIISKDICPILPNGDFSIDRWYVNIVIDGNTTTKTGSSGSWEKTVVDGNTTILL
jgi:hypothetical protein